MKKRPEIKTTKPLNAVSPVNSTVSINTTENKEIFYQNVQNAIGYFTSDNAPSSYEELKKEIKVLEKIHAQSFLILSHRLKIIKDQELYKKDGYNDFKSFVEGELDITRAMVYGYIKVLDIFGVYPAIHDTNLKITSLMRISSYAQKYPEDIPLLLSKSSELSRIELGKWLKEYYETKESHETIKEESEEEPINFYSSEEELINNSKFVRAGMKEKTVKAILKDMTNWLLLHKPKNNKVKKIIDILKEL